ncbi:MAG: CopG family transcriptional regulator [Candidatus Latescibacterota bacterium]|nr:MAG: CopG family transcriptional regulator [Candidatus Latescibacterota bacterium]
MRESRVTIKIPRPLYRKISQVIDGSGFSSPTEFIVFILRDLVGEKGVITGGDDFTLEELRSIRRKLQGLGYLE